MVWYYKLIVAFVLFATLGAQDVDFREANDEETPFSDDEFHIEERSSSSSDGRWRTNTFSLEPGDKTSLVGHKRRNKHNVYYVNNFGREAVTAYIIGHLEEYVLQRIDYDSKTVNPGEYVPLDPNEKRSTHTRLWIQNNGERRAIFQARESVPYPPFYTNEQPFHLNIDLAALLKTSVVFGVSQLPVVGDVVSTFLNFFWPSTSSDVWEEVKDKVKELIDKQMNELIETLLENKIRVYKRKISMIDQGIKRKISKKRLSIQYMNIAQDMIGIEEDFRFKNNRSNLDDLNYATLPLYSTVVSMKMMYYRLGMGHPENFGLDEDEVEDLKMYALDTIYGEHGAIAHIRSLGPIRDVYTYNHAPAENIYNEMAAAKSFVGINGEMFIDVWKNFIVKPNSTDNPSNNALLYDTYVGRPTGDLQAQGAKDPPMQHLTANLVDEKRPKIVKIEGHTKDNFITGLEVFYKGGQTITSGLTTGTETSGAGFGNNYIKSIVVVGDVEQGPFNAIVFNTDDNKSATFGYKANDAETKEIKHEGYQVSGVHISHDGPESTRSWNLAISWQPDNAERE